MVRAIFFDAYGTLFASGSSPTPAEDLQRLLELDGVRAPLETVRRALSREMAYYREHQRRVRTRRELEDLRRKCGWVIIEELGGPAACPLDAGRVAEMLLASFPAFVFMETGRALRAARQAGLKVGVLSNFSFLLPLILEDLGLLAMFDLVVYSAEAGAEKPDPAIFREAVRRAGVSAAEAMHVGDTYEEDVLGAIAAGLRPVLLDRDGVAQGRDCPVARNLLEAVEMAVAGS